MNIITGELKTSVRKVSMISWDCYDLTFPAEEPDEPYVSMVIENVNKNSSKADLCYLFEEVGMRGGGGDLPTVFVVLQLRRWNTGTSGDLDAGTQRPAPPRAAGGRKTVHTSTCLSQSPLATVGCSDRQNPAVGPRRS